LSGVAGASTGRGEVPENKEEVFKINYMYFVRNSIRALSEFADLVVGDRKFP
jgi:hypothetical protein